MECERCEQLIPTYAGDDLDAVQGAELAAHLRDCAACAALAASYRESLESVREASAADVDDTFYSSIRATVLAEIAREHRAARWRPLAIAAALGALAAATLLAALVLSKRPAPPSDDLVLTPEVPESVAPVPVPPPAPPEVASDEPRRRAAPRRRVAKRKAVAPGSAETAEMMRIEYQTADPNIRVIWFVPRGSDAPTRHEKSGI